ncbi:hypothetical protein ACIA5D_49765 [Actinoplanes sp. NPDC051513]|uniref:hypothetical protein n=1 Tax=Actinoplanes sp. NPDC051513 TaxID=3363908 RepID=UPI003789E63F
MIKPMDDRGSLPMAMLVVLVGITLSGLLANLVLASVRTSSFSSRRVMALHAAQAGLDVGLAQVRAAWTERKDGDEVGLTSMLPCDALSGKVDPETDQSYTVTPAYYQTDPQEMSGTELADKSLVCLAGKGTFLRANQTKAATPAFALFTANGCAGRLVTGKNCLDSMNAADRSADLSYRTLAGTYIVHTTNANISGGLIHVYRGTNSALNDLCIDAGASDPAEGALVTVQLCSAGKATQTWAYTDTLQIQLVSSQTPADHPNGMCLDTATDQHAVGLQIVMATCQTTKPALYRQAWSFNDSANLMGSKLDGSNTDGYCFNVQQPNVPGSNIILTKTCSGGYDNIQTFSAEANVGAGAASSETGRKIGQLVDYNQFGRCLDDTGQNPDATFMIAWPCKQNPNPNNVLWNQRYTVPALPSDTNPDMNGDPGNTATGIITMTKTSVYCLQSPQATAVGKYVTTKACTGAANQVWQVFGHTGNYFTSYQIVDNTGLCLTPRDPTLSNPDLYQTVNKISKIYVARCDGSTLQKWNANKNVIDALALKDLTEK